MKLSQILRWTSTDGKHLLMRLFYYTYIPIILILGYKSMNIQALFPQLASKQ
ncbi:unnamed protein product [Paramecium primaurelia]|uniref:Uncharacterized protein n=1 Tax=Paramecium primaurelia TaxID=5886 RepID=A0A8S1NR49_PARPR|nr:unnamed protein product [Paramecium primaurelia]